MTNRNFRGQLLGLVMAPVVIAGMVPSITARAEERELGEGVTYYDGDTATTDDGNIWYLRDDNWHGDMDERPDTVGFRLALESHDGEYGDCHYLVGPGPRGDYNQYSMTVYREDESNYSRYYVLSDEREEPVIGIQVAGGNGEESNPYRFRVLFGEAEGMPAETTVEEIPAEVTLTEETPVTEAPSIAVVARGSSHSEPTPEERAAEEYRKAHPNGEHTYMPKIIQQPVGEKDGVMVNVCVYCGHVERDSEAPVSAYEAFNIGIAENIHHAPENGTATVQAVRYHSIARFVLEDLAERPDETLVINYLYEKEEHTLVIAGNDPRLASLLAATEDEYFGMPYLNTLFGEVK